MRIAGRTDKCMFPRNVFLQNIVLHRPESLARFAPCFFATATYSASKIAAVR